MEINSTEMRLNYQAAERAISIALCVMGSSERKMLNPRTYKTTYTVSIPQYFLGIALPVLSKYLSEDLIEECILNAQEIALARKARGWSWWMKVSFFASLPCLAIHFFVFLSILLILLFICSIIFGSRKIVGKIWTDRDTTKETDVIVFEKMIEECKKSSLKICIDYMVNKFKR